MHKPLFRWLPALAVWVGMNAAGAALAAAQGEEATAPVKQPPPGYEKFEPAPESEQVDAANLVIIAYGAVFVGMFGYVVYVARGQAEMSREMVELAARIEKVERP